MNLVYGTRAPLDKTHTHSPLKVGEDTLAQLHYTHFFDFCKEGVSTFTLLPPPDLLSWWNCHPYHHRGTIPADVVVVPRSTAIVSRFACVTLPVKGHSSLRQETNGKSQCIVKRNGGKSDMWALPLYITAHPPLCPKYNTPIETCKENERDLSGFARSNFD
jgi:hypothetical protein